ncbi:FK506-binding protein 5-like [Saccostrea cucullata]|uniref:FK506-binding protein 5-like n=1 Tax=Saccostrea cuccullata TaxID=36930 RepID=UPI002ED5BCBD
MYFSKFKDCEVLPADLKVAEENLSKGCKESLEFLKQKYGPKSLHLKSKPKPDRSISKELIVHIMDGKNRALKRAFPTNSGLSGCLKISTSYSENAENWMAKISGMFRGKIEFIPCIMGNCGIETIESPREFSLDDLEKKTAKKYVPLKIYARARGKERREITEKYKGEKFSEISDEDFEELDLETSTPKKKRKGVKASTECYGLEHSTKEEEERKEEPPQRKTKNSPIIIENDDSDDDCKLPKLELSRSTQKEERKRDLIVSTECYGLEHSTKEGKERKEEPPQRKTKNSPIIENEISDELPDIEVPCLKPDVVSKEDVLEDLPLIDKEVAAFCDVMEKKIKRKEMADGINLKFPEKGKMLTVIYENHGGMSFSRPFHHADTVQSVYTYICQIIEPEILPATFHLECVSPTACKEEKCMHCYELGECYDMSINQLPALLVLKEGNYLVDETMTFFGNVFLKKN